jgi:CRP-like cAMP-binding protein
MTIIEFKPKKFFLSQGEFYDNVYIVVSGELKIFISEENGRQILLDVYKEGDFIGEQEVFLNYPYSASVINSTECTLIKIPNKYFIEWISLDANINQNLLFSLCQQMYDLTNKTQRYALTTVKEQVIKAMLDLQTKEIVNKKQLIQSISATPRSVYRVLNELEMLGFIKIESQIIKIINEEQLTLYKKKGKKRW